MYNYINQSYRIICPVARNHLIITEEIKRQKMKFLLLDNIKETKKLKKYIQQNIKNVNTTTEN